MELSFLERLYEEFYCELPDSSEEILFRKTLIEHIEQYADPKYDKESINEHFSGIISSLSDAKRMTGLKEGISLALQFFYLKSETPDIPLDEMEQDFLERLCPVKLSDDSKG